MAQRAYFLMPNRDCPPNTVMKLGQIFTDLKAPLRRLAEPLEPLPTQIETYKENWQTSSNEKKRFSLGVYTQFLASILGIGGDADIAFSRANGTVLRTVRLDTIFIEPDEEYVERAVAYPPVREFFTKNPKVSTAYMVTGIKIARNAAMEAQSDRSVEFSGETGVDGTPAGVPVQIGPKGSVTRAKEHVESFEGSSDFVFAYRIRVVYLDRKTGNVRSKDYVKGALYDDGPRKEIEDSRKLVEGSEEADEDFEVAGLSFEDFGIDEKVEAFRSVDAEDDDGVTVKVLQPM
jgi:hypothetical protein